MSMYLVTQALTESFINLALGITVVFENVNTDPPNDAIFCTLTTLPAIAESLGKRPVGDADQTDGIFQASFYAPSGTGYGEILQLVQTVLDFYKHTTVLTKDTQEVQIQNSGRNGGRNEDGWYIIDVSIEFFAYIDRT
jgi:hypothetical protein